MTEHPVGQAFIGRFDVCLENSQHSFGHITNQCVLQGEKTKFNQLIQLLDSIVMQSCRSTTHLSMFLALRAIGIVFLCLGYRFLYHKGRLYSQTAGATDQIVAMQKLQCIIETLLTHIGQNLGLRWKQNAHETIYILA